MVNIGNIVADHDLKLKINNVNIFSYGDKIDNDLPTMLIGYEKNKNKYDLDFFTFKIDNNLYWGPTRLEDRSMFSEALYKFIINCEKNLVSGFEYYYIDPFEFKYRKAKRLLKTIIRECKYVVDNDMVFFIGRNKVVMGLHIGILETIGFNRKKFMEKVEVNVESFDTDKITEIGDKLNNDYDVPHLIYIIEKLGL